jgi:5-methylcytosine-specific restriction endonuclease McrA
MASRQVIWAQKAKLHLRNLLGNACARCGAREDLEFDCIVPQGHAHHTVGTVGRATFYRRQFEAGNLQLLCGPCHVAKSRAENRPGQDAGAIIVNPF